MKLIEFLPKEAVIAQIPDSTSSYTAIPHTTLVNYIEEFIRDWGYTPTNLKANVARGGSQLVGTIGLGVQNTAFEMRMGFRNSYDKSMSVGIGIGAEVFVCSNGMFIADVQKLRKHTVNVWQDIDQILLDSLNYAQETFKQIEKDALTLRQFKLSKAEVFNLIGQLFIEDSIINTTQLNILKNELYHSKNFKMFDKDEVTKGDSNGWYLYNNITESLKTSHPLNYFKNHAAVHSKLVTYATI